MSNQMSKVLFGQLFLILAVAAAWLAWAGTFEAQSALYGGAMALLNTFLLGRRLIGTASSSGRSVQRDTAIVYLGAAQRFALTLGLLIIGMGGLKLAPPPMIAAFAVAQLGFLGTLLPGSRSS